MARIDLRGRSLTRAAVSAAEINRRDGGMRRYAEVRNVDEEARTVEVAFSSEAPVRRWFGDEVLVHEAGALDFSRLLNGAAVLWNHDTDVQIGVVESARLDSDRVGRAVLRFGNSQRAQEIWADIVGGIVRHVSVGYEVVEVQWTEREGEADEVRITEWQPFEISLVSVPADPSVGVGRSAAEEEPPEESPGAPGHDPGISGGRSAPAIPRQNPSSEGAGTMETQVLRNAAGDLVRARVDENGSIVEVLETLERASVREAALSNARQSEQQRCADLMELGRQYGHPDMAQEAIRDGKSVDELTRALLEAVGRGGVETQQESRAIDDQTGEIGMSERDADRFSFVRAIRALANPNDRRAQEEAAFEFEASQAAADVMGRDAQGIMVPFDVLSRALNTGTGGVNPGDTGGFAVATDLMAQSFIDLLRNRTVFMGLATPMGGLMGNFDIPSQVGGATGYWLLEDADASEENIDMGLLSASPRTCGAYVEATRRQLMQSSLDTEALMRSDLARALGLTIDYAGFYGTGSTAQPLGIKNVTGINAVDFVADNPSYAEIVQMETEVSADNADVSSMAYVANARFRGHAKTTEKFGGSNGATIWEQGGTVNGYRTEITNQIIDGDVFHGDFASSLIGMWGGLDLTVDPYTHSQKGRLRVVAFQDVDFLHRRPEGYTYGDNLP